MVVNKILKYVDLQFYFLKNWLSMFYTIKFKIKHNKELIPKGIYCYSPNFHEGKYYNVTPCVYYKTLGKRYNGCKYCRVITDDCVFADQCKICEINDDLEDDEK